MSNYDEKIGKTVMTDAGDYTIVAHVGDGGFADNPNTHIDLYVGRHTTGGNCGLLVSDNASTWALGSDDDPALNYDQWQLIAERCGDLDLDAIRAIDADLADWLAARRAEATIRGKLDEPRAITDVERRLLAEANYDEDAIECATVIAEENSAKLYNLGVYGYAVEGETGEMIADLDFSEALVQWR